MTLALALLSTLLLAGTALAATKPGTPTAKAPKGPVATTTPIFTWSKAKGAARYELRVYENRTQKLKTTGITKLSWKALKELPTSVALSWKVRASNAPGAGAWSRSLTFTVAVNGLTIGDPYRGGKIAYVDGAGQHGLIAATANRVAIGGFAPTDYWISSEHAANYAFAQYFGDGGYGFWGKYMTAPRVRAVRAFDRIASPTQGLRICRGLLA